MMNIIPLVCAQEHIRPSTVVSRKRDARSVLPYISLHSRALCVKFARCQKLEKIVLVCGLAPANSAKRCFVFIPNIVLLPYWQSSSPFDQPFVTCFIFFYVDCCLGSWRH